MTNKFYDELKFIPTFLQLSAIRSQRWKSSSKRLKKPANKVFFNPGDGLIQQLHLKLNATGEHFVIPDYLGSKTNKSISCIC